MPRFMIDNRLYGWDASEETIKQWKKRLLLLSILNAVISIACGLVSTGVTRHNWVGFAATAALIALMVEVIAAVRFLMARSMLDRRSFESLHQMMRWSAQCHLVLMALAFAAGIVSCVQAFDGIRDVAVLVCFVLSFACSFFFLRLYDRIPTYDIKAPE
ncbi:MAG: hypothetical protein IJI38_01245 [Clostridia bacterium]|nr:hypothetical protein [Clostridia bacterium]